MFNLKFVIATYFYFFISGSLSAQEIIFTNINRCVDFDPGASKLYDCREGVRQAIPTRNSHYLINGIFGVSTKYETFRENCGNPRDQFEIRKMRIGLDHAWYDFICLDSKRSWILFADYNKDRHNNIVFLNKIKHYTCSTLDFPVVAKILRDKISIPGVSNEIIIKYRDQHKLNYETDGSGFFQARNSGEEIQASIGFNERINAVLNCAGGVILSVSIETSRTVGDDVDRLIRLNNFKSR